MSTYTIFYYHNEVYTRNTVPFQLQHQASDANSLLYIRLDEIASLLSYELTSCFVIFK